MWPSPPFLYPPLASPLVAALSALSVVMGASMSVSELRGENLAYSKFRHRGGDRHLPSRVGMLLAYAPALVAALASFAVPGAVVRPARQAPRRRARRALPQTGSRDYNKLFWNLY
ncbi:hypothetical protein EJB05_15013, partial [Eragrostis curvula]